MSLHTLKAQRAHSANVESQAQEALGYVIDDQGREVAITEDMIQQACDVLDEHWITAPAAAQPQQLRG